MKYFIHLPMKMEPIQCSETSAIRTQTPGNYPKENILQQEFNLFTNNKNTESFKMLSYRLCLFNDELCLPLAAT